MAKYNKIGKCKVNYQKRKGGGYFAKIPSKTKHILGAGRTKKETYKDVQDSLKKIKTFKCSK